jgi:osmotically-inducible protein OsmY
MCAQGMRDARARRIMANQHGRNGATHDDKEGWRKQEEPPRRREDEWDDRDAERRGMGQSGYGAGRSSDDRSMGTQVRNTAWSGTVPDRGTDDRWTGRGNQSWDEERGERDYGRGRWEEGRIGMSQGYGYQDGDRPSFERGMHDPRFGGMRDQRGSGGPYGGGGYEPDRRSAGSREQEQHGGMGYGGEGRHGYGEDRAAFSREQGGYRQHQSGFGGAQGLDVRRGPHRGKGPKGFEPSDERIRERVCEALADDHNIDASNIEVSVHKGEVTLTGGVDDRDTKRMAEDCVLQCSGVRDVHNQLRVHR